MKTTSALCKKQKALTKWILKVAIPQFQNTFVIPNAAPFIEFGLNMLATGRRANNQDF